MLCAYGRSNITPKVKGQIGCVDLSAPDLNHSGKVLGTADITIKDVVIKITPYANNFQRTVFSELQSYATTKFPEYTTHLLISTKLYYYTPGNGFYDKVLNHDFTLKTNNRTKTKQTKKTQQAHSGP